MTKLNHHCHWRVGGLSEGKIKRILKDFGITEIESEVYLFLASHDALKGTEIARKVKKDRAQVYHILKSLQAKGLVESTFEAPVRFTPVPFERVVESTIKLKRDEAARIESIKQELFDYWKNISRGRSESPLEKFSVIEENNQIYPKIFEMINKTKRQFSIVSTIQDLLRADQYGLLDAVFDHPLKSHVQFRFLTELSEKNVNSMKGLLGRKTNAGVNFKGRNPNLGLPLSPRTVMRDEEEILLFITPTTDTLPTAQDEVCFWTNCKALLQMFVEVFEDLWTNSTDINEKIEEIESGKPIPTARVINDAHIALETYNEIIRSAEVEIIMMTSSKGLIESWKHIALLKERVERGVSVRIMTPITSDNLQAARELLKCCSVKHVPTSYLDTLIVDGKRLFQSQVSGNQKLSLTPHFYTDDFEYVEKTKKMLNDVWRNASIPSAITLESILKPTIPAVAPLSEEEYAWSRPDGAYQKTVHIVKEKIGIITEKDVLNKIINAKKYPAKNWPKDVIRLYGSSGHAVIYPPDSFNLPNMMIWVMHENKQSSFGVTDRLFVYLWLETPKGYAFVPVAVVTDNPGNVWFEKVRFAGTPAGQNVQLVKRDELQVRVHGNTVFAGWTKPIPLLRSKCTLPPSCIMLEGYSRLKTGVVDWDSPSGVKTNSEFNGFDAFVTFFHPASKYSGPGTDGTIGRDIVVTLYPP